MVDFVLTHLFLPHSSNNHRARVLHPNVLIFLTLTLLLFQVLFYNIGSTVGILGYAANISPAEVITITNQKRAEAGAHSLSYSQELSNAAMAKAQHMVANNYWAHVAPDGTEPWKFFIESGYSYKYAGENLARDFSSPESAVNAWMASPSHKENLLSLKYSDIGIAVIDGNLGGVETTLIVQLFGARISSNNQEVPIAKAATEETLKATPIPQVTKAPLPTATPTPMPTPSPTPTEEPVQEVDEDEELTGLGMIGSSDQTRGGRFKISPFLTTRNISIVLTASLIGIFILDAAYISYRKIPRIHGRTAAHLVFLGMVLTIVLVAKAGSIL